MSTDKLIEEVASGSSATDVLEKAITNAGYDPRFGQNKQTTVWADECDDDDLDEDNGETHDSPDDYGQNPMAGTRKMPRGSHEAKPPKGDTADMVEQIKQFRADQLTISEAISLSEKRERISSKDAKDLRKYMTDFEKLAYDFMDEVDSLDDAKKLGDKITKVLPKVSRKLDMGKMTKTQAEKLFQDFENLDSMIMASKYVPSLQTSIKKLMALSTKMRKSVRRTAQALSNITWDMIA